MYIIIIVVVEEEEEKEGQEEEGGGRVKGRRVTYCLKIKAFWCWASTRKRRRFITEKCDGVYPLRQWDFLSFSIVYNIGSLRLQMFTDV